MARTSGRPVLPDGPPVWMCGGCHAGNLGPVASSDATLAIQVRDLAKGSIATATPGAATPATMARTSAMRTWM